MRASSIWTSKETQKHVSPFVILCPDVKEESEWSGSMLASTSCSQLRHFSPCFLLIWDYTYFLILILAFYILTPNSYLSLLSLYSALRLWVEAACVQETHISHVPTVPLPLLDTLNTSQYCTDINSSLKLLSTCSTYASYVAASWWCIWPVLVPGIVIFLLTEFEILSNLWDGSWVLIYL